MNITARNTLAVCATLMCFVNNLTGATSSAPRPNILIIFTDDQGYADLGCFGNTKNKTPRMDQLAREGTRFTNFYAQSVCGPSRSALLTGRYPIRSKGWSMPADEITFAELIAPVGYQTACIGKWDVSNRKPIIERMPNAQGFDYFFGTLGANDNGTVHFHENNNQAGSTSDMGSLIKLYTDKSIDYLKTRRNPEKPFLLYLAHTMMHTVIDASPDFKGRSAGGLYGDVVEEFDYHTGRLLDCLDELKLSDNTLVLYTSDNGPWNQPSYRNSRGYKGHPEGSIFWGEAGPLRDGKGSCYEGGYRLPCIARWPGRVPAGRTSDAIFATIDFMPTFAVLAGFNPPNDRVIDGIDQSSLLLGKTDQGRENFYFQSAGVRQGAWKYIKPDAHRHRYAVEPDTPKKHELYNLNEDIGERNNLAEQYPEKVEQLALLMDKIEGSDKPRKNANSVRGKTSTIKKRLNGTVKLKQNEIFSSEVSPEIVGKTIRIKAKVKSDKPDGVIIAQGGYLVGYALYLHNGQVVFGVRANKKYEILTVDQNVTGKEVLVEATLDKNGRRTLSVNDITVSAEGEPIRRQPKMGLSTGEDQSDDVGKYKDEYFVGSIVDLTLTVE